MTESREIHILLTGPMGEGKTTIAAIIRKALEDKGISVRVDRTVGMISTSRVDGFNLSEHMIVNISEEVRAPGGVQKDGLVKRAVEAQHGSDR